MAEDKKPEQAVAELLDRLRADQGRQVPQGSLSRLAKNARAGMRVGFSVLRGRLGGRGGEGLSEADLKHLIRIVTSLGELKGLAMKAGQMLSYLDPTMPDEVRSVLALLQTQSQPMAPDVLRRTLTEDLAERAGPLLDTLEPEPHSVASIGQVHRGRLPDGTQVAVKVVHPGMAEAIRADFRSAKIGKAMARLMAPGGAITVSEFVAEAQTRMLEECDYAREAARQQIFANLLADHPVIRVPAVHLDWSSERVLTTTWEPGQDLEDFLAADPSQQERDLFGRTLFEFYFGSLYKTGWFHADPHPGNYAFRDSELVLYDFGCVRRFDKKTVAGFVRLARAVAHDDRSEIEQGLAAIGAKPPDREKDYQIIRSLLRGFYGPLLDGGVRPIDASVSGEARDMLRSKVALMRMRLPGKFLFLFRIRFGLYAVLARLGSVCDWRALEMKLADGAGVRGEG